MIKKGLQAKVLKNAEAVARIGHSAVALDSNTVFIWGGAHPTTGLSNDGFLFLVKKLAWKSLNMTAPPAPRYQHAVAHHGKYVYIHGGATEAELFDDMWRVNTETWEWTQVGLMGEVPCARNMHTLSVLPGKDKATFVLMGGALKGDNPVPKDAGLLYVGELGGDDSAPTITFVTPTTSGTGPTPRFGHVACPVSDPALASAESVLMIHGGMDSDGSYDDVYTMSLKAGEVSWTALPVADDAAPPRGGHFGLSHTSHGKVILGGGMSQEGPMGDVWLYAPGTNTWEQLTVQGDGLRPCVGSTCVAIGDGRLWLHGGADFTGVSDSTTLMIPVDVPTASNPPAALPSSEVGASQDKPLVEVIDDEDDPPPDGEPPLNPDGSMTFYVSEITQ